MIFSKNSSTRSIFRARPGIYKWAPVVVAASLLLWTPDGYAQQDDDDRDRGWVRDFDSVTVEEIKPDDLPSTVTPGESTGIRTDSDDLPEPASQDELEKVVERIDERVVQVVSVQTPPRPYRQVPMLHFGHALWVNTPGAETASLVTPLSWLKDADAVYLIPSKVAEESKDQEEWRDIHRRSLESVTVGKDGRKWLEEHEDKLVELEAKRPDKHRNLVTLSASSEGASGDDASDRMNAPAKGLELFDVEKKAMFRVYGFTPFFGKSLISTTLLPNHPEEVELAFYWQSSFPALLGAPLVSEKGDLVAINIFRHPKDDDIFLAIPTGAIKSYLSQDDEESP